MEAVFPSSNRYGTVHYMDEYMIEEILYDRMPILKLEGIKWELFIPVTIDMALFVTWTDYD
jgi:hypothetical protein